MLTCSNINLLRFFVRIFPMKIKEGLTSLAWNGTEYMTKWKSDPLSSVCVLPEVVYLNPHCNKSLLPGKLCENDLLWYHWPLCSQSENEVSVCVSHGDERWNNAAVICFNELTWTGYAATLWFANYDDQDIRICPYLICTLMSFILSVILPVPLKLYT